MANIRRLTAKNASVHINAVKIGEMKGVTATASPKFIESEAFGDFMTQSEPDGGTWKVDCDGFAVTAGLNWALDAAFTQMMSADPTPLLLAVYQNDGNQGSTLMVSGYVWMGEGSLDMQKGQFVGQKGAFVPLGEPESWMGM